LDQPGIPASVPVASARKAKAKPDRWKVALAIVVFLLFGWPMLTRLTMSNIEEQSKEFVDHINNQVAEDAVKQYEIAERGGNAADTYVHAGIVAAAYLQAKDEANYQKWKQIESAAARKAGMPSGF
jgi:hypothetical protein